jgi:cytoskeleton protein RodZ
VDASGIGPRAEAVPLSGTLPPPSSVEENGRLIYNPNQTDARVILTAKGNVWLQIEDSSGQVIANLTLNAGDQYRVPNMKGLEVIAKDGGLISASLDGRDMGTLGAPGEILVSKPLMEALGE